MLWSSDQLFHSLEKFKLEPGQRMVLFDVEYLSTNVPVEKTIDIIVKTAFIMFYASDKARWFATTYPPVHEADTFFVQ